MSRRPRLDHSAAFKAKVAEEALHDGKTVAEIAQKYDAHPNQVSESGSAQLRAADCQAPALLAGVAWRVVSAS